MATQIKKFTTVIVEREADYYLLECRYCKGSGKKYGKNSSNTSKCPICSGKGLNKIDASGKSGLSPVKCQYCKGSGHKYGYDSSNTSKCPICSGIGVHFKDFPRAECGYCEGSGHKYGYGSSNTSKCPTCKGIGSNKI